MTSSKPHILQGWKSIAAHVERDVSTVKRWEKYRGLPVRRVPGEGRANVYAHVSELSQWLDGHTPTASETHEAVSAMGGDIAGVARSLDADTLPEEPLPRRQLRLRTLGLFGSVASFCLIAVVLIFWTVHHRAQHPLLSTSPHTFTPRASAVPGVDELCRNATYLYEQRSPDTMRLALQTFEQAAAKDPKDALAWSGIANSYTLLHEYGLITFEEAYPHIEFATRRAISLDPTLGDPHAVMGFVKFFWMLDIPTAEHEFKTALQIDPASAMAHSWYGFALTYEGRFPEAIHELATAQSLQPESTAIMANRAFALGLSGHRDEAVALLQQVGYNKDNAAVLHHLGTLSLLEPRNIPRYLDEYKRLAQFRHDTYTARAFETAQAVYNRSGENAMWRSLLASNRRVTPQPNTINPDIPRYEALLGDNEAALGDLSRFVQLHRGAAVGLLIDPAYSTLHRDPRFRKLLTTAGFLITP